MAYVDMGAGRTITMSGTLTAPGSGIVGSTYQATYAAAGGFFPYSAYTNMSAYGFPGSEEPIGGLLSCFAQGVWDESTGTASTVVGGVCSLPSAASSSLYASIPYSESVDYQLTFETEVYGLVGTSPAGGAGGFDSVIGTGEVQLQGSVVRFYEMPRIGSTWSITIGGQTTSGTVQASDFTTATGNPWYGHYLIPEGSYAAGLTAQTNGYDSAGVSATMTVQLGASVSYAIGQAYSGSHTYTFPETSLTNTIDYDYTGGVSFTEASNYNYGSTIGWVGNYGWFQIPMEYQLQGAIYALDELHPESWDCTAVASGENSSGGSIASSLGPFSGPSISQSCAGAAGFVGWVFSDETNQLDFTPYCYGIACGLDQSSLAANGEPYIGTGSVATEYDCLIPVRCAAYDALSVSIESEAVWDPLTSIAQWTPGFTDPSPAGYPNVTLPTTGTVQFDTTQDSAGNPPTQDWVEALYPTSPVSGQIGQQNLGGYRYLYFEAMCSAGTNVPFTLQIKEGTTTQADKIWPCYLFESGTWQAFTIDLCAPLAGGVEEWQQETALLGLAVQNSWGVELLAALRLNLSPLGQVYRIRNLRVQYVDPPRWSCLSEDATVEDSGLEPLTFYPPSYLRCGVIDTDGKRSEMVGSVWDTVSSTWVNQTLSSVASALSGKLGWTVSYLGTSDWQGGAAAGFTLGGNGGIYPGTAQGWIDEPFASGTIQANYQAAALVCPPAMGDICNGGVTSAPTIVYLQKTMRSRATGIAFNDNESGWPVGGETIALMETSAACGSGMSDTSGRYLTGPPYAIAPLGSDQLPFDNSAFVQAGAHRYSARFGQRQVRRICPLAKLTVGPPLAYDVSKHFRHGRLATKPGYSTIWMGTAPNGDPYDWSDFDTGVAGDSASGRWEKWGGERFGMLVFVSPSTVRFALSPDEGRTWNMPMTITSSLAAGGFFDYCETSDFNRWFFWLEGASSPYTVYMCQVDARLNVIQPAVATTIADADLAALKVSEFPIAGGGRGIGINYSSGGAAVFLTSRDGVNFS